MTHFPWLVIITIKVVNKFRFNLKHTIMYLFSETLHVDDRIEILCHINELCKTLDKLRGSLKTWR